MSPEEYLKKKKELETLQREEAKLQGVYEEQLRLLKRECGTDSLSEAEKILKKLQKELTNQEEELEDLHHQWEKKWQKYINGT